ncbi:NYN domain-containing protein [Planctomonas sp. JC2975]|uniref:NYN domain-containing protein n=1 Tax=Planctomonas sp. JC2975 TaxID=2729626 RepID=UPI001475780F|nr:NYN domain-containing protein [Planctomonas sp. JC2975]NNC11521.1 NYN domain-containing protein [Planctomonas sp. JC2975]
MAETSDSRVAVYIDFDNIVISRYDQVNGRNSFTRDRVRQFDPDETGADSTLAAKLDASTVDVGAVIDFAASFGTLVLTRAYADWSAPVNADYRHQLVGRAVDLVQLFPAAAYAKNGADIRLAVDAVEDMFRLPDLTHVVIVAGDSDYVPLAQRCKRLGRYVVGIGVAGSTSRTLAAACDEFYTYDALPGVERPEVPEVKPARSTDGKASSAAKGSTKKPARTTEAARRSAPAESTEPDESAETEDAEDAARDPQQEATSLLGRALRIGHEKDDSEWLHSSAVKSQIKRMDPSFSEKQLGFRSFSDFIKSRADIAELDDSSTAQLVRLKPGNAAPPAAAKRAPRRAKG